MYVISYLYCRLKNPNRKFWLGHPVLPKFVYSIKRKSKQIHIRCFLQERFKVFGGRVKEVEPLLPTELLKTWENSVLNFPPKKHTYHGLIETTIRFMKITQKYRLMQRVVAHFIEKSFKRVRIAWLL